MRVSTDRATEPDYVRRPIDDECRELLEHGNSLLIVGAPISRTTRTAAELLRSVCSTWHVIAPYPPDGVREVFSESAILDHLEAGN